MAGTFPSSIKAPDYPFDETFVKRKVMSKFESGHELSRATATVGKRTFRLSWNALPEAQYQTLKTFFDTQGAETFDWIHPLDLTTVVVRFAESELSSKIVFYGHRKLEVLLHEVP